MVLVAGDRSVADQARVTAAPVNRLGILALVSLLVFLIGMTAYVTAKRLGYI